MRGYTVLLLVGVLFMGSPALALVTGELTVTNLGVNDELYVGPGVTHELGNSPPFPDDEVVVSSKTLLQGADYSITITNDTLISWTDLIYVADPETSIGNEDGTINGCEAFNIDALGINTPLMSESIEENGIFEPQESWTFLIESYDNSKSLDPHLYASLGVGGGSSGDVVSTGSIVAIPEPVSASLLLLGLAGILRRRSRK